jgi:hypothetical protein
MRQFNSTATFDTTPLRYPPGLQITREQRAQLPTTKERLSLLTGVLMLLEITGFRLSNTV